MNLSSQGAEIVGAEDTKMTGVEKVNLVTAISGGFTNLANSIWGPKPVLGGVQPSGTPAWLLPVAIGGIGIIAIAIIAGKKK